MVLDWLCHPTVEWNPGGEEPGQSRGEENRFVRKRDWSLKARNGNVTHKEKLGKNQKVKKREELGEEKE